MTKRGWNITFFEKMAFRYTDGQLPNRKGAGSRPIIINAPMLAASISQPVENEYDDNADSNSQGGTDNSHMLDESDEERIMLLLDSDHHELMEVDDRSTIEDHCSNKELDFKSCDELNDSILLHTTQTNIGLLQSTDLKMIAKCMNALRPELNGSFDYFGHFDRINMIFSIPEIALVIAASQRGFACVLSLVRYENSC